MKTTRLTPPRLNGHAPMAAAAPAKSAKPEPDLVEIVRPEMRDRFAGLILRGVTPARVRQILDGAFTGNLSMQFELFDLMEDTWPRLKKNLNEVKRSVIQAEWRAIAASRPEQTPTPLATRKADFLNEVIQSFLPTVEDDENSFEGMLYDLCDAVGKGVSVQEIYWDIRPDFAGLGSAVVPRATRWIPPRYFGYWSEQTALQLSPDGLGGTAQPFPPDKFIVSFFKTKTGHPVGGALLRSLATMWIGSNFSYDWALNLAQVFGLPFRWVEYDPTQKGLLASICKMLENMGSAGWGAFPAGTKLELHESAKAAGSSPQAYLMELADTACDILLLGQTLTTSQGHRGSQALGRVHSDVREDVIRYIGHWAASALNYSLVPALMRLNFGDNADDPYLVCELEEVTDEKAEAERDAVLLGLGLPVPRKWFYERHNIPEPGPQDEVFIAQPKAAPPAPGESGATTGDDQDAGTPTAARAAVLAKDATDKVVDRALEDLTGVEARWLGGVKPFFAGLVDMAEHDQVTDADFIRAIEGAIKVMPELFDKLDASAVEDALFNAMSAGLVNGAVAGFMRRRKKGGQP